MMFTPNGLSVRVRVFRIRDDASAAVVPASPTTPQAPAFDIAEASSGPAIQPMPTEKTGTRIPISRVRADCSMYSSLTVTLLVMLPIKLTQVSRYMSIGFAKGSPGGRDRLI